MITQQKTLTSLSQLTTNCGLHLQIGSKCTNQLHALTILTTTHYSSNYTNHNTDQNNTKFI